MRVPAIVTAGDRHAAKTIHGESKVWLAIEGRPLVAHVVETLQEVDSVSEVWVVGDRARLEALFADAALQAKLRKPLHLVEQHRNLFENGWETYRRLLPGAGPGGRDPSPEDEGIPVLYLSADIPFATAQEVDAFVRQSLESEVDYALGLVTQEALEAFYPGPEGEPGIRMAYFNLREGRFRQSNLHLLRPGRIRLRHHIEEMYENRHQREVTSVITLAWRLLVGESGGLAVLYYYSLMHLAGLADRKGRPGLADAIRRRIPIARIERGCSGLLGARFRFVVTEGGGCAVDIDSEDDYATSAEQYERWRREQRARVERLYGALPARIDAREASS